MHTALLTLHGRRSILFWGQRIGGFFHRDWNSVKTSFIYLKMRPTWPGVVCDDPYISFSGAIRFTWLIDVRTGTRVSHLFEIRNLKKAIWLNCGSYKENRNYQIVINNHWLGCERLKEHQNH